MKRLVGVLFVLQILVVKLIPRRSGDSENPRDNSSSSLLGHMKPGDSSNWSKALVFILMVNGLSLFRITEGLFNR